MDFFPGKMEACGAGTGFPAARSPFPHGRGSTTAETQGLRGGAPRTPDWRSGGPGSAAVRGRGRRPQETRRSPRAGLGVNGVTQCPRAGTGEGCGQGGWLPSPGALPASGLCRVPEQGLATPWGAP